MSLPRRLSVRSLPLLLAAGAALSAPSAVAAEGATTKEYKAKNYAITVPKGWTITDVEGENANLGYVCVARREISASLQASAWVLVKDAGGANLADLLSQVRDNKVRELDDADAMDPTFMDWAGAPGAMYLRVVGHAKGGSKKLSSVWGAIVKGKYHQLEIRAFNGVEEQLSDDFDAIMNGYRFLAGAGVAPTVGSKPEGGGTGPVEGEAAKASERFDKLGATWTLPKDTADETKPRWRFLKDADANPHLAPGDNGMLAVAGLLLGEEVVASIDVRTQKANPGVTAKWIVNRDDIFDRIAEANFSGHPVPNIDEDVKLGNLKGASRALGGTGKNGKKLHIRIYFATLREVVYEVHVVSHEGAESAHAADLSACLAGLVWDDTTQGVRGPWATPFPSDTTSRADAGDAAKESSIIALGFTGKKPVGLTKAKFDATQEAYANWAFALEGRKPGVYMFVGAKRIDAKVFQDAIPPKDPDSLIDDHETLWKNELGDPKTLTQRGGKSNKTGEGFKTMKGSKYEFSGTGDGAPVFERGWVCKQSRYVYWIRVQYVGPGAEAAFEKEWRAFFASVKVD